MSAITNQQIDAAVDSFALSKIQTKLQLEGQVAAEAAAVRQTAIQQATARQADAAEAMLAEFRHQASQLNTVEQEWFVGLFRACLDARKQSMTTATSDTTLADNMRDAMFMAQTVWPEYRLQLSQLGNVAGG